RFIGAAAIRRASESDGGRQRVENKGLVEWRRDIAGVIRGLEGDYVRALCGSVEREGSRKGKIALGIKGQVGEVAAVDLNLERLHAARMGETLARVGCVGGKDRGDRRRKDHARRVRIGGVSQRIQDELTQRPAGGQAVQVGKLVVNTAIDAAAAGFVSG